MDKFNPMANISHRAHVTNTLDQHDMIIGRELLQDLGIDLHFSISGMYWQEKEVIMKESTCTKEETFHIKEDIFVSEEKDWIAKILDAKYVPADLQKIVEGLPQLDKEQQDKLLSLLQNSKKIFDGTLDQWKGSPTPTRWNYRTGSLHITYVPTPFLKHMNKRSKMKWKVFVTSAFLEK